MGIKVVRTSSEPLKKLDKLKGVGKKKVVVGIFDRKIAQYAVYVEYGWVQRTTAKQATFLNGVLGRNFENGIKPGIALVNPPRPFLGGTFLAEHDNWKKILQNALKRDWDPEKALKLVGERAFEDVRQTITKGGTSDEDFPRRSPLTMALLKAQSTEHRVSTQSATATDQPLQLSGDLLNSITYKVV